MRFSPQVRADSCFHVCCADRQRAHSALAVQKTRVKEARNAWAHAWAHKGYRSGQLRGPGRAGEPQRALETGHRQSSPEKAHRQPGQPLQFPYPATSSGT